MRYQQLAARGKFVWTRRKLAWAAVFFAAYVIGAWIGGWAYLHIEHGQALVWAPSGLSMAAVYLGGFWFLAVIPLASLFYTQVLADMPLIFDIGIACANVALAGVGAYVLRRFNFDKGLSRLQDLGSIAIVALFVTMLYPTVLWGLPYVLGMPYDYSAQWLTAWLGNMLSVLLLTPLIISWSRFDWRRLPKHFANTHQVAEIGIAFSLFIVISFFATWTPFTEIGGFSISYLIFAILLWVALRFGVRETVTALTLLGALAISGIFFGVPSAEAAARPLGERLMSTEQAMILFSVIYYVIASLYEERRRSTIDLKDKVEELERALAQISASERAKTEFIAILAHELRNPLTPIVNYVELIKRTTGSAQTASWISGIETNMKSVITLLNDILDVSRVTERKFKLTRQPFVLQDAIENSSRMVEAHRKMKRVRLSLSMPREPLCLDGDRIRLEQAITNILHNAIKFTPSEGFVGVEVALRGKWVMLRVEDEGVGVAKEDVPRLFEPFVQLHPTTTSQGSGLGIGLFLAKNFVELHGGRIEVEARGKGFGAIFTIMLPASLIAAGAAYPSPLNDEFNGKHTLATSPKKGDGGRRVLIVDDKLDAAVSLARLIESSGFLADVANDGAAALKAVSSFEPDTIFLDIRMPGMDGYQVARELRKLGVKAKIIALTGFGQIEDKNKAEQSGFDAHLTKPVDIAEVLRIIAGPRPRKYGA